MLIGLSLGLLEPAPLERALETFARLRRDHDLAACEVDLEASLHEAACWPWDVEAAALVRDLRGRVRCLGVHLPYLDLAPLSANPRARAAAEAVFAESLAFAADVGADYAVFHARGAPAAPPAGVAGEAEASGTTAAGAAGRAGRVWGPLLARLGRLASDRGLALCLENADDLRDLDEVAAVLAAAGDPVRLCLDLGHLHERRYPDGRLERGLLLLHDRHWPAPFRLRRGLPWAGAASWPRAVEPLLPRLACLHLHDHDGRRAHRPLGSGRIDLGPLRTLLREGRRELAGVPVILEADYREAGLEAARRDLARLEGWL